MGRSRTQQSIAPQTPDDSSDQDASPTRPAWERFYDIGNLHVAIRLGTYRVESLYWGNLGDKWWRNYLHAHSFLEVCYAYEGAGEYRIADSVLQVGQGDLFIATPGLSHEIISSRSNPLGIVFWAFTLVRQPDVAPACADATVDELLEALPNTRRFARRTSEVMQPTLALMVEEMSRASPGYTQAIAGLVTKVLLEVARTFTDGVAAEAPAPERGAKSVVRTAVRYLKDNFARPIEVRDVAAQVHLSERHLSRIFVREAGMSIVDYLTQLRLDQASQLLVEHNLPIKQIARMVGYPDPHYFTTLFGRKMGMTPALFRTRLGTRFNDEAKRPLPRREL